MGYLKGNYKIKKNASVGKDVSKKSSRFSTEKFEEFAKAKLGGSIAFIMKKNTFLWTGDK